MKLHFTDKPTEVMIRDALLADWMTDLASLEFERDAHNQFLTALEEEERELCHQFHVDDPTYHSTLARHMDKIKLELLKKLSLARKVARLQERIQAFEVPEVLNIVQVGDHWECELAER
jgi:hypothetical protein